MCGLNNLNVNWVKYQKTFHVMVSTRILDILSFACYPMNVNRVKVNDSMLKAEIKFNLFFLEVAVGL
jgi:NADH/NAD ratio-sensing transcriptional regulator Rex